MTHTLGETILPTKPLLEKVKESKKSPESLRNDLLFMKRLEEQGLTIDMKDEHRNIL